MSSHGKDFINELGNQIHIEITKKEINGAEGVLVSIIGPTSEVENHITVSEAKVLVDLLNETLDEARKL